jgi:hypothetical protein
VLQTAKPVFDSDEMMFDVAHYGMEYKVNELQKWLLRVASTIDTNMHYLF